MFDIGRMGLCTTDFVGNVFSWNDVGMYCSIFFAGLQQMFGFYTGDILLCYLMNCVDLE